MDAPGVMIGTKLRRGLLYWSGHCRSIMDDIEHEGREIHGLSRADLENVRLALDWLESLPKTKGRSNA